MQIMIINGPNLNLLGKREPSLYGNISFEEYLKKLRQKYTQIDFDHFQSNIEGEIINAVQNAAAIFDGIILNAGGYTHTSVAIADVVRATAIPVVEVHISNVFSREDYRHISLVAPYAKGIIIGFGLDSYRLAVESLLEQEVM